MNTPQPHNAKTALRKRMAYQRDSLMPEDRAAASEAITARLLALPEWAAARTLFLYLSFRSEVSTRALLLTALESGRRVLAPRVNRQQRTMDACAVFSPTDLAPGAWGILEPTAAAPVVDPREIDLVIAPGLAFDAGGGAGWVMARVSTIAICGRCARIACVPGWLSRCSGCRRCRAAARMNA